MEGEGKGDNQASNVNDTSSKVDDDETDSRPQKRKRTMRNDLSKGPTMKVSMPRDTDSEPTNVPEVTSVTNAETEVVVEIQHEEEIQSKLLASQTLEQLLNLSSSGSTEKGKWQSIPGKIKEYQDAVKERDDMIGQLKTRLAETLHQRDKLIASSQDQELSFKQETEKLRMQLQQAIDMVTNQTTGVNMRDHVELKNKLIALQQEKLQQTETIELLSKELENKNEVHGQLEYKYRQSLQKFKVKQNELEKITNEAQNYQAANAKLEGELAQLKEEHKGQIASLEEEKEAGENRNRCLGEEKNNLVTENNKMRDEIQNLMQKLQQMAAEAKAKEEMTEVTQARAEEQFGVQLTLIKQQMSELHAEEISKIKSYNESEIAKVSREVDALQQAHQEDVASLNNVNLALKGQMEIEQKKAQELECVRNDLVKQLEDMKVSKDEKVMELEQMKSQILDATNRLGESEQRYGHLQASYEELSRREKDLITQKEVLTVELQKSEVLKEEFSKLEEEVKAGVQTERECMLLKEEKNLMNLKIVELGAQVEKLSVENGKLEAEVKRGKDDVERLNMRMQQESSHKSDLETECERLKSECESLKTECECLKNVSDGMNAENALLNSQIKELEVNMTKQVHLKSVELGLQIEELTNKGMELEGEIKRKKEETDKLNLELQREQKLRSERERQCENMKLENDRVTAEFSRLNSRFEELAVEKGKSDELRNCISLLEGRCKEAQETKEEYEKKCSFLNDKLLSLDRKLAEAHKLHLDFEVTAKEKGALKMELDEKVAALNECEVKLGEMGNELKQIKVKCEKIERDKIDVELDRDKLVEQYKMMNAELASTMLALDREVQLSTHRRLSDIGSSLSKVFGDFATQTDEQVSFNLQLSGGNSEKDMLIEEALITAPRINVAEHQDFGQRVSDLEKENKDLHNEIEKLKTKLKDEYFVIKSMENENSILKRRQKELEVERRKFRADQQEYHTDMLEKLEFQKQLAELKLSKNIQEQTWRQQEMNVSILLKALKDSHDLNLENELSKTVASVEESFSESHLRETFSSSCLKDLLDQTEEFDSIKQELNKALSRFLSGLEEIDKVHQEKLVVELENISLKARVSRLMSVNSIESEEATEETGDALNPKGADATGVNDHILLEKELLSYKCENERLQRDIKRQAVLLNLEKQHLQSPKLKVQVHSIMQDMSGALGDPLTMEGCVEVTMRFLRQAILKNVSSVYIQTLGKTLTQLEDAIIATFNNPSVEILGNVMQEERNFIQCDELLPEVALDCTLRVFTEKVEQLINVRTTLVDAANELVEQLEEAVTVRLSPLKLELEDLLKVASGDSDGAAATKPGTSASASVAELSIEPYQAFVQEFVEVTNTIAEEAQGEKLQILQNQKALIQKILEDDKIKLNAISQEHLRSLGNVTSLPDAIKCTKEMVSSIETTLSEEIAWVDHQYKELMNQYTYEQKLCQQSHTSKLKELESSLTLLLKTAPLEVELVKITSSHKAQMDKLREEHRAEVKHLENQIAIQDNEMLRHLQSLYSDRDWYRRTVGLLSHVTLQLLHYFSVSESYIKRSQSPNPDECESQEDVTIQQQDSILGVVKDLSFLSDCKTDYIGDNVLSTFPEDSAVSTGLISKNVLGDHSEEGELASNSGSMLDSTVLSEGLLDDMDKDEQVRSFLTKFYPQLMSILKGRWDRVLVDCLEKEVQELTIALQASAGMLKIFMHGVISENRGLPSYSVSHEFVSVRDIGQGKDSFNEAAHVRAVDASHGRNGPLSQNANLSEKVDVEQVQNPSKESHSQEDCHQPSTLNVSSSHFGDLSQLVQDLTTILSQDETLLNLTTLKTQEVDSKEKLKECVKELCALLEKTEGLQLQVHHQEGIIHGLEEERKMLQEENQRLDHYSRNLAMELQVTKDELSEYEMEPDPKKRGSASSPSYAEKLEASKDTKEKVRAVLSAKTKSTMDHSELVARNGELQRLLESLVQDYDKEVEGLKSRVADLSQQLEVADRQLRSNRQFLDEQANDREKERDDLLQEKEKLAAQLREKDNLQLQHENMTKEVESLERDLHDKTQEYEDAILNLKELQVDLKAACDKISDQRDIISSLEVQLEARNLTERDLHSQNEKLIASCNQYKEENEELRSKLEEHLCEHEQSKSYNQEEAADPQVSRLNNQMESEDVILMHHHEGEPLSLELLESCETNSRVEQNQTMVIEEHVKRISNYITSLIISEVSASQSEEDLSERSRLSLPSPHHLENERALSPASFSLPIEERLANLERTAETAVKRMHDMQMTEKNLRDSYEELMEEKNLIQERMEKHAMEAAKSEARLDEFRRLDHPQCAALQQKITNLQEELESRRNDMVRVKQENEELKHALSDTRAMLKSREKELERLQSAASQNSPVTKADYKQLLEELQAKDELIEDLKKEKKAVTKASSPEKISISLEKTLNLSDSLEELRRDFSQESLMAYPHMIDGSKAGISQATSCEELIATLSSQQDPSLSTLHSSGPQVAEAVSDGDKTSEHTAPKGTPASGDKETLLSLSKEECHSLSSATEEINLLKVENQLLQKEIRSLNEYQAKLEDDFKVSQRMVEARDEEILQLSEEMMDSVNQPLPSEVYQMQQTCQHLQEQLSVLQGKYEEVSLANTKYKDEMDNCTRRYEEVQAEAEKLRSNNEMLMVDIVIKNEALTKLEEKLQCALETISEKSNKNSSLQDELINVQKSLENEKFELQSKEARIKQLTLQLETLRKELAEWTSTVNKDKATLEQHYQEKIAEMKSEQKRLISDYEEKVTAQITDLSAKYAQEKEAAVARQLQHYEAALQNAVKEKRDALQQVEQLELRLRQNSNSPSSNLQYSHLSDSWKDLSEGVREEVSRSRQLDNSLVSYMRSGLDRCDSVQPSTRSSSVGDESEEIRSQLQLILAKIQQEGVQILTSVERSFLHKHCSLLDSAEKSLIASVDLSESSSRESSSEKENSKERTQLVRRIAELESELSNKDRELRKLGLQSDFRLEQERLLSNEWKASLEDEKKRRQELSEQLQRERESNYDKHSDIAFLKSQVASMRPKLQKLHEENNNLCESNEMKMKQVETLQNALQAERNHFRRVSNSLNAQRRLGETTKIMHANVVKELQKSLKEERERSEKLYREFRVNKMNKKGSISAGEESVKSSSKSGVKSAHTRSNIEDLQTRLAIEQERVVELQRKYDRERGMVASLQEQAGIDRSRINVDLMEEQAKNAELTAQIKNLEIEKDKTMRVISEDKECLRQRELQIRELENKLSTMENDIEAQNTACQLAVHKFREEDAQLRLKNNQNHQKLMELEAENCALKQKIRLRENDLELCREKEQAMQEEIKRERMAIDRLGLPALARSKNLDEYFELQVKENFELCKLVLRNLNERDGHRERISALEDKVHDLTQKLAKANSANFSNSNNEAHLRRDLDRCEREISSLRIEISQKEAELQSRANSDNNNYMGLSDRLQHVYGENIRIKSRWKSLIYQKQYLLTVIQLYQCNEQRSIARIHNMVEGYDPENRTAVEPSTSSRKEHLRKRFRICVLGLRAMFRMQYLVQKWSCNSRVGSHILFPLPHQVQTSPSSAYPLNVNNQPESSSTIGGVRIPVSTGVRTSEMVTRVLTGGQTPPTRGPSSLPNQEASRVTTICRNLFVDQATRGNDELIERLDNIHSQFGLNIRK